MKLVDVRNLLPIHKTKKPSQQKEIKRIVLHTTDTTNTILSIAKYDVEQPNHISKTGCPTITYHYIVLDNGDVCFCTDENNVTWHAGDWNANSIAVAMNYKTNTAVENGKAKPSEKDKPSADQFHSTIEILSSLCLKHKLDPKNIFGHRELEGSGWKWVVDKLKPGGLRKSLLKTCPGMTVDMNVVRDLVAREMQQILKDLKLYDGEIDGDFGPKSLKALQQF